MQSNEEIRVSKSWKVFWEWVESIFGGKKPHKIPTTVKPRLTNPRLIRTPYYYEQFALSLGKKALKFSLNSTRLIPTPR